ncbi:PX domain-containing protein EREL1 isoform X1 [Morus notabilis]|uniref:PX domain-containing protein EREL1 isoform X1 n=2 Tax=Morus notabilis TaxID=981085 RepID=UPI000CED3A9C|nr:PX domain-containing protein EREL1 isoform X1 [Morus notabilis]
MQGRSPPKHRHDGTSPLPLGMDWSPPPRKWNGRDTVWPHDSRTGWSYCVTIPSWVVLPKSRDSDPVVFYRVHVGVQSPEGVTTTHGVLRRFNDFLKLFTDLKKVFPKKNLPSTPPKGLLRLKSRALLEERRCSLEEWMTKLLSDIDVSRSVAVATFLELEAAARSSFQDVNPQTSEANSRDLPTQSSLPTIVGSSSAASDYGSDTAYEISELGTPRIGMDDNSELGIEDLALDEDLTGPIEKLVKYGMANIDEGLFMGQTILEQLEGLPRNKVRARHLNNVVVRDAHNGNSSKVSYLSGNGMDLFSEPEHGKVNAHARKLSNESVGSDVSSLRGSETSNFGIPNSSGNGSLDLLGGAEVSSSMEVLGNSELHTSGGAQLVLPLDQRHKMSRLLLTMQRRLVTAKTDMEDLIARLNQEIAVKDYLATKVKDLEVELETDRQKSRENLQQAILIERERFTQMQWDMEELRQKSLEMELKLKSKSDKDGDSCTKSTNNSTLQEKDILRELGSSKEQLEILSKQYEELEARSKADRKVLVKEVKSLRSSQAKLEHELSKSLTEKSEAEKLLEQEKQKSKQAEKTKKKLLHQCKILYNRLNECNRNSPTKDEDKVSLHPSSPGEALDLLKTSDDQINFLLNGAKLLTQENGASAPDLDEDHETMSEDAATADDELRNLLANIFIDNVRLRKQVNSVLRGGSIEELT